MSVPSILTREAPKLPEGLSVQIKQQSKLYEWDHAATIGGGDKSLNGLIVATPQINQGDECKLPPATTFAWGGVPSEEERKTLSQNYYQLPNLLTQAGFKVMDDQRDKFIEQATKAKQFLKGKYGEGPIPAAAIADVDKKVNKYSFRGVEVIVTGFTVTENNPKGSHRRKDGLYVTQRVLRRCVIDRALSEGQQQQLANAICGQLISESTHGAEYRIRPRGTDRFGNPVFDLVVKKGGQNWQ